MPHRISVERNRLRFAAGHFATLPDGLEPLHGHNYDLIVEVEGPLTGESWVIDFSLLKQLAREICQSLDHKFLLQMHSRVLSIKDDGDHYVVQYKGGNAAVRPDRVLSLPKEPVEEPALSLSKGRTATPPAELSYRIPKRDVAPLPLDNTTAERLAEYIASELKQQLAARGPAGLLTLKVGVEEMPGQTAWYLLDLGRVVE